MEKLRFVGLDVHKDSVVIAVGEADGSHPAVLATVPNEAAAVLKQLKKLARQAQLELQPA